MSPHNPAKKLIVLSKKSDPRYLEIANRLRELLMDGHFRPGQRFLSIRQLIKETKRSLPTVRSALELLVEEGLLEARLGSGFYVTNKVDERREQSILRLLVVIPSYASPREPWFTGRIVAGMLKAAGEKNVVISFYQRKVIFPADEEDTTAADSETIAARNLEHILAFRPDGVAWLHGISTELPQLNRLLERKIPIVSTIRHLADNKIPIIREDDFVFASLVLTQFQARGHRRIGLIIRPLNDDYFDSKIRALKAIGQSLGISVKEEDHFVVKGVPLSLDRSEKPQHLKETADELESFIMERPEMTGLFILASSGIHPMIEVLKKSSHKTVQSLSIVHNILDGVKIPPLPNGQSLATVAPPLEDIGAQIVHALTNVAKREPMPPTARLVPTFQPGDSLRSVDEDH